MEKINNHNYEAFFLDYLEGNLSAEEKHDLFLFLEINPDLKKELEVDFLEINLNPSDVVFENKKNLKVEDESLLTLNTVNGWMIESLEGNLEYSKQLELNDFVKKHKLEKTYSTYQATKLTPDLTIVFADKKKLKVAVGIIIPMYARVASIAAAVVFLIGFSVNQFSENSTSAFNKNTSDYFSKTVGLKFVPNAEIMQDDFNLTNVDQHKKMNEDVSLKEREKNTAVQLQQNHITVVENMYQIKNDTTTKIYITPHEENKLVKLPEQDTKNEMLPDQINDVAIITPFNSNQKTGIISEEPYKIITNAASNIINKEISFSRDKNVTTNNYVAYGFKIGNFEFERKKAMRN